MRGRVLSVALLGLALRTFAPASAAEPPAKRVVSMNPSLTAILIALDASESLVGVDDYSAKQQPAAAGLPTVGGLFNPSLEAVVALEPDLVVLVPSVAHRDFRERLEALGIPLLVLSNVDFEAVLSSIGQLGSRVGRGAAARERIAAIREVRARIARATSERSHPRSVFVIQRDPLFLVGHGSFLDELLRSAGAVNLGAEFATPYPRVTKEWLVAAAPDVILDSSSDPEPAAEYWARWPSLPAVRAGRVLAVPQGEVTLPGPYLDRSPILLAHALHGEELLCEVGVVPTDASE